MERLWTRDFIFVTLSTFFVFLNLQMITPALSSYIQSGIGSNGIIGLSTAAWALSAVVTRILAGKALMTGSKRRLMWMGLIIYLIATVGYFFATSVGVLICVRVLYGIGFGLTTTTYGTLAADVVPQKRVGEGMGYFGLSTSLAMAIAPLMGIGLYNSFGFHPLVFTTSALVVGAALIAPFIRAIRVKPILERKVKERLSLHHFYDKRMVLPCILLLLMSVTYGGLVSFITLYGRQIHIANVGWFFLVNAGAVVFVRPISGKLFDTKGHRAVVPLGALCVLLGLVLLSFSTSFPVFLLAALLYGMGYGSLQPALQAWMFQRLSKEKRGIGSGAFYNAMDFGIAVGSLILGIVANWAGYAIMYRTSSLCIVLLLVVYARFGLREKHRPATMGASGGQEPQSQIG